MVNQAHAFVQKSSNDVWPQKNHFPSRNARPGLVVLFFSSAIYYLFSFGRVWQFIQRLPFVGIVLIFQENIRKLVFVTICSQPVTHQSIHSMWPAVYFVNLKKEMDYARNAANFPIFLSLNLLIVGLNRTPLLLSSMKYSIADRHQYILV